MEQKLIKLSDTHYIVVDDSEINVNDFITDKYKVWQWKDNSSLLGRKKVTHSTQPLEKREGHVTKGGGIPIFDKIKEITLSEIEEIIYGFSVEKMAEPIKKEFGEDCEYWYYEKGFKAHQELVKDKLFTIEDLRKAYSAGLYNTDRKGFTLYEPSKHFDEIIQPFLPKTEWEIEFNENGIIKLI